MNRRGFTLIEVMMMVWIIAILATFIMVVKGDEYLKKSRDSARISYLVKVLTGLRSYHTETNRYPTPYTWTGWGDSCLSTETGAINDQSLIDLVWNKIEKDPRRSRTVSLCGLSWVYGYRILTNDKINDAERSFMLVADVETNKKSNYIYGLSFSWITDMDHLLLQDEWTVWLEIPDPNAVYVMTPESQNTIK